MVEKEKRERGESNQEGQYKESSMTKKRTKEVSFDTHACENTQHTQQSTLQNDALKEVRVATC